MAPNLFGNSATDRKDCDAKIVKSKGTKFET